MADARAVALDTSAVLALFLDEPFAEAVLASLRSSPARMSTVNLAEVVDVLVRAHGGLPGAVVSSVEDFASSVVQPVAPTLELALRAGELRAQLFDRRSRRLSLADCFVLATAEGGDRVITGDRTLADAARATGLDVISLQPAG